MKKVLLILSAVAIILALVGCSSKVRIPQDEKARLIFRYDDKNINTELSDEDSKIIRDMFNGKDLYFDTPACGFTENVAVKFGNTSYCIANDSCGSIRSNFKYFSISDREELNKILEKYGAEFPCV